MLTSRSIQRGLWSSSGRSKHTAGDRSSNLSLRCNALFMATKKDATAELLQGAINYALKSRLRTHNGINVDVQSNAFDLMGGKFGGMTVVGTGWRTPLQLTAQTIKVSVGELQVDKAALLFQQKVALENVPLGSCTLTLSPADLGNFMVHKIMKGTASRAIQGKAIFFDPASVQYVRSASGAGLVLYQGNCAASGQPQTYTLAMDAPIFAYNPAAQTAAMGHTHNHGQGGPAPPPIRVRARRAQGKHAQPNGAHAHVAAPIGAARGATATLPAATIPQQAARLEADEDVVSNELTRMFNTLTLNLQGVELSTPRLRLMEQPGGTAAKQAPLYLEIHAQLRLLSVPPLNMQF